MKSIFCTALVIVLSAGISFGQSTQTATQSVSIEKSEDGSYAVKSVQQEVPATQAASTERSVMENAKSSTATRAVKSVSGSGSAAPACSGAAKKPACCASKAKAACGAAKTEEPN